MTITITRPTVIRPSGQDAHGDPHEKARELVAGLGGFRRAVDLAAFFRKKGVRGVRGNSLRCGVANWLKSETGESFVVSPHMVRLHRRRPVSSPIVVSRVLSEFIVLFDAGYFPDLFLADQAAPAGEEQAGCDRPGCQMCRLLAAHVKSAAVVLSSGKAGHL